MEKICSECGKILTGRREKYCSDSCKKKYFYQNNINGCRDKQKEYNKKNKEIINKNTRERRRQKREYINDYKLKHGCYICGYNGCVEALDFHHVVENKEYRISRMVCGSWSVKSVEKEIAKCIILCKNCHAEFHYNIKK